MVSEPVIEEEVKTKIKLLNLVNEDTMITHLGINLVHISRQLVVGTMPVNGRTQQPFGLLHGGASAALIETICSLAAWLNIDESITHVVCTGININHLRSVKRGLVTGKAVPLHIGRMTQVWEAKMVDDQGHLAASGKCSFIVMPLKVDKPKA